MVSYRPITLIVQPFAFPDAARKLAKLPSTGFYRRLANNRSDRFSGYGRRGVGRPGLNNRSAHSFVLNDGLVDMSLDQTPAVGWTGKHGNIFYGIGFSGHGVNLTSVFGQILADLLRGKYSDWQWFPYLNRFPPYTPNEPFRWLGVQAALGYYKRTDPGNP